MSKKFRGAVVAIGLLLAGCYSSDQPALEKGEWAPLAGKFSCDVPGMGASEFVEQKNGWIFSDYTYRSPTGEALLAKKIGDKLYLAQAKSGGKPYSYLYLDFVTENAFVVLAPNVASKGPYIEILAKKYEIQSSSGAGGSIKLTGAQANLLAFLSAHDRPLTTALGTCKKA